MTHENDLIRRGDVIAVLSAASRTAQKTIDAISAIPAAQDHHDARADTVAEMIRQAVDDTTGLHLVIAAIREATVGGKPMLSDLPSALLEWRQAAVQAEREACAIAAGNAAVEALLRHEQDAGLLRRQMVRTNAIRAIRARGDA